MNNVFFQKISTVVLPCLALRGQEGSNLKSKVITDNFFKLTEGSSLHQMAASFIDPENSQNFGEQFLARLNELIRTGSQRTRGFFTTFSGNPMYVSTLLISKKHGVSSVILLLFFA